MARRTTARARDRLRALIGLSALAATTLTATIALAPSAAAVDLCALNRVTGTTTNRSGDPMRLESQRHGATNAWCNLPDKSLQPGETDKWQAGDNLFSTDMRIAYVAPNNDLIALSASMYAYESPRAQCIVVPNGNAPSPYRCEAKAEHRTPYGANEALVTFVITRK
jgi:hypothetical protein